MSDEAVADEFESELDDDAGKKKLSGKKIVLFIVLPLLLLGGGAAGVQFSGLLGGGEEETEKKAEEAKPAAPAPVQTVFYELPEMVVNLNSRSRRPNFLKIKVSLELTSDQDAAQLDKLRPRIIDNFQVYLRELRIDDLRGSAGVYRLREELLARVNAAVHPTKVTNVLFKEVLVQ